MGRLTTMQQIRGLDTLCIAIFNKVDNFCDFILLSAKQAPSEKGFTQKEKICFAPL